jgi:5-amino-6-(5-phospho-D-ribitylamino)uracil phosphatase
MLDTLFVTDLDGTFLAPDGRVRPYSAGVVRRATQRGARVTCATARSWTTTRRMVGGAFTLPVVVHDGAATMLLADGTVVAARLLSAAVVDRVLSECRSEGAAPLVHTLSGGAEATAWLEHEPSPHVRRYWRDWGPDPRSAPKAAWQELPRENVLGVAVVSNADQVGRLQGLLSSLPEAQVLVRADTYRDGPLWLEVTAAGVSKGSAVRALAQQLGAHRVVVFGDSVNDLPLFAVADESYAMATADPQVLAHATGVIGSNDEEAVAHWLAAELELGA